MSITGTIDLHSHSRASDGSLSPAELIALAKKRSLLALALTDHDTIDGLEEAKNAAKENGINFIPGIELEISMPEAVSGEFHLLGLGIDQPSKSFMESVAILSKGRDLRNREIFKRMESLNIKADYDDLVSIAGGKSIGRPHIASYLVKQKMAKNMEQAFKKYLGRGRPLYIQKPGLNFDEAIMVIQESGGLAILAHPMSLYAAWGRLPDLVKSLKERGLDGLEAWHPAAKPGNCKRLEELGKSLGLCVTAGSDYHGEARPDRKLGITAGRRKIDSSYLKAITALTDKFSIRL